MDTFIQPLIIVFREGLEAFLIVAILLEFLTKSDNAPLKKYAWQGAGTGIAVSFVFGMVLMALSSRIGGIDATAKIWESVASFVAVILITTFIVWMIKNGSRIKEHIHTKAALNLTAKGIFALTLFMVAREGVEISIFAFAGKYTLLPILAGLGLAVLGTVLVHFSIVKSSLKTIFAITLGYLILQAGFLMGYSIHEGLSVLHDGGRIADDSWLLTQAFNLSDTVLNHKEGILGLPLYVLVGWYSKPEWIQLVIHYGYVIGFFLYWRVQKNTLA